MHSKDAMKHETQKASNQWRISLPADVLSVVLSCDSVVAESDDLSIIRWILDKNGGQEHDAVLRYVCYLKLLYEQFHAIAELYDTWSPPDSKGTKQSLRLIGPDEMLVLAHHLYVLDTYNVPGVLLECGCAHGFSTCCLSLACDALGRKLVVADSFQGLPPPSDSEPFFRAGDYASTQEKVLKNVHIMGKPRSVEFIPGWYAESLVSWTQPIALLWMDVDLYESARDVLDHIFPFIDSRGAIFTHEFTDFHGTPYPAGSHSVPGAIYERYARLGCVCHPQTIMRYFGSFYFEESVQSGSSSWMVKWIPILNQMDERYRRYEELLKSRTVRTAFALKRLCGLGG